MVGLVITVAILVVLRQAAREIYRRLMDAVDPALVDQVEDSLRATPGVLGVGQVRLRWIGHQLRAECEVVVDAGVSAIQALQVTVSAEHGLLHALPRRWCTRPAGRGRRRLPLGASPISVRWPGMQDNVAMRLLCAIAACAVILLGAGCAADTAHPASSPVSPVPPDPHTARALLAIAAAFNHDYDTGEYGPVYDRWDPRSQAIITRADYIRRHTECPSGPQSSRTESASPGPRGTWLVRYDIDGQQLTDYWFYVQHQWVFDLVLSDPGSVQLYRMPAAQYVKAIGCTR